MFDNTSAHPVGVVQATHLLTLSNFLLAQLYICWNQISTA
jgi:hypothetical protein